MNGSRQARPAGDRSPLATWLPFLAVGALLGAAAVAAALSSFPLTEVPFRPQREPTAQPRGTPSGEVTFSAEPSGSPRSWVDFTLPAWLTTVATVFCVAAVLAIVVVLIWYLVRDLMPVRSAPPVVDPSEPDRLAGTTQDVVDAVEAGLVDLSDSDTDPRRAIIACWLRLEEAAAAAGTPREIGDTSTDLVVRLLGAHRVSHPVLDGFAAVYRQARYSTGPVDEGMRAAAVSALRQLRAELAAEAAALAEAAARAEAEQAARAAALAARLAGEQPADRQWSRP